MWARQYIDAIIQHDVRDVGGVFGLDHKSVARSIGVLEKKSTGLRKVSSHRAGSGLYAVINTAGSSYPLGISRAGSARRIHDLVRQLTTTFPVARLPMKVHYRNDQQCAFALGVRMKTEAHSVWSFQILANTSSPGTVAIAPERTVSQRTLCQ